MHDPQYDGAAFSGPRDVVDFLLDATTAHAIVAEDLQGRVILWNRGAESLYGCTAADAVGALTSEDLYPPSIVASGLPARMRAAAAGDGHWNGETVGCRRNGEQFAARVAVTPWRANGGIAGFLLVSQELTHDWTR